MVFPQGGWRQRRWQSQQNSPQSILRQTNTCADVHNTQRPRIMKQARSYRRAIICPSWAIFNLTVAVIPVDVCISGWVRGATMTACWTQRGLASFKWRRENNPPDTALDQYLHTPHSQQASPVFTLNHHIEVFNLVLYFECWTEISEIFTWWLGCENEWPHCVYMLQAWLQGWQCWLFEQHPGWCISTTTGWTAMTFCADIHSLSETQPEQPWNSFLRFVCSKGGITDFSRFLIFYITHHHVGILNTSALCFLNKYAPLPLLYQV